jgi:membrane protein required for colicin V production
MAGITPQVYDFIMLGILVLCTVLGARKGMAWQVASLAALLASAGVAVQFSPVLAPYLSSEEPWNRFAAMLVLYVATSLAIWLVFHYLSEIISRVKLKEFDRQLGALFGAAKGVLLCLVVTFFAVTLSEPARQTVLHSRSGYYTALFIHRATPVLPQEVRAVLGKYIEELDQKLDPAGHVGAGGVPQEPLSRRAGPAQGPLPAALTPRSNSASQTCQAGDDAARGEETPPGPADC